MSRDRLVPIRRTSGKVARAAASIGLQRLPRTRPAQAFFNSFGGKYSDNPRGIYDEMARRRPDGRHAWVAEAAAERFPSDVVRVRPSGWRYFDALGRSGLVVSNVQLPSRFHKRRDMTYLQTWHGTPLKRIGSDNDRWKENPEGLQSFQRDVAKWDFLVSQNAFSTEIFRRAFGFDGEILEEGYPRNDVLNAPDRDDVRRRVRADLGIEDGTRVVLYAPTWRDTLVDETGAVGFSLALDLDALSRALGGDHVVLLRLHYLIAANLADASSPSVRNVSQHPDIRDLYLAADVLLTDYSSAMFDFAVTGKPMLFFTYDLAEYRDQTRGFYFELESEAPGPLCTTTDDIVAALRDLDAVEGSYRDRYERFRRRYCPFDDGHAARRILARIQP